MVVQAVLDVGATKVGALVCSERGGRARVLGYGLAACSGAAVGAVSDLEATAGAIRRAVAIAERRAGRPVHAVYASVSQPHAIGRRDATLIADREALVLSAERAGLRVLGLVPSALASAAATLSAEERERGAALIDLGAGVTNVVVYSRGAVAITHVVGFGSADLTASIAAHFGISPTEAEFLKRNVASAVPDEGEDGLVAVPSCSHGEGTSVPRRELARMIEARLTPMWRSVERVIRGTPLEGGVAITGGGCLLHAMPVLAERVLEHPVRRASPFGLGDLPGELQSPDHATLVGLGQHVIDNAGGLGRHGTTWGPRRAARA